MVTDDKNNTEGKRGPGRISGTTFTDDKTEGRNVSLPGSVISNIEKESADRKISFSKIVTERCKKSMYEPKGR